MNVAQTLDHLRADADFCRNLTKWHSIPPREARYAPFPEAMHPDLVAGMKKRSIHQLYTHQADAIAATLPMGIANDLLVGTQSVGILVAHLRPTHELNAQSEGVPDRLAEEYALESVFERIGHVDHPK